MRTNTQLIITILSLASLSCAPRAEKPLTPKQIADHAIADKEINRRLQTDPVGFLREMLARTEAMTQYRLTFYRQERLGLFGKMSPLEKILASFRSQPFSVKFEWDDPDHDFYESVYVAGKNNNKLLVRERKGWLNFPPQVRALEVMDAVKFGRSKNPVTDFGLAQLMRRTLRGFDDPRVARQTTVKYLGLVNLDPIDRPAHYLRIQHPPVEGYRYARQDFYIDSSTNLPAGTDLYLPSGALDARYRYADIDLETKLISSDFRLTR